ncbi:density-regulated protein DRP1 [Atractiella rhizophila]|nr:density-regulated protein DRP1 [Atractiella rhizophila]
MSTAPVLASLDPLPVYYCTVCSLPPEYCSYGSKASKCRTALEKSNPSLYESIYSESAVASTLENLTLEQREALEKDVKKKERKEEQKEQKAAERRAASKVTIRRVERNKRKHVTHIQGLEVFNVDLKKAAKLFATKFATGSSVSKNPQGEEEIVIQGDVAYEVQDLIVEPEGKMKDVLGGGSIEEDNVVVVDKTKKKKPTE